jgi:hypothetical protein
MTTKTRVISYLSDFFINDRVFNRKTEEDGVIVDMYPQDRALIRWRDGTEEWLEINDLGQIKNIGKILEWDNV